MAVQVKVNYSTYGSNEAMYAKIKTLKGKGYDLVVPSTYYVDRMRREGLLQKIDKTRLSNLGNLNPRLLNQSYDPNNEYSIPYLWGTTGIAVNTKTIAPQKATAWADLWDPAYKNKLLLLNDMREVLGMGLKVLDYSVNSTDEREICAAYEKLTQILPNIRVFNSESPKALYLAGEVQLGMDYNGSVYRAHQENSNIQYIYPKEGVSMWLDSMAIPSGAEHVEAAHQFIDFVLRPEIASIISTKLGYTSPNLAAIRLLPEEVRNNRIAYPTEADLKNAEFEVDVGEALSIYEKYWQQLKAGR